MPLFQTLKAKLLVNIYLGCLKNTNEKPPGLPPPQLLPKNQADIMRMGYQKMWGKARVGSPVHMSTPIG